VDYMGVAYFGVIKALGGVFGFEVVAVERVSCEKVWRGKWALNSCTRARGMNVGESLESDGARGWYSDRLIY
jgi:hypothetical protein